MTCVCSLATIDESVYQFSASASTSTTRVSTPEHNTTQKSKHTSRQHADTNNTLHSTSTNDKKTANAPTSNHFVDCLDSLIPTKRLWRDTVVEMKTPSHSRKQQVNTRNHNHRTCLLLTWVCPRHIDKDQRSHTTQHTRRQTTNERHNATTQRTKQRTKFKPNQHRTNEPFQTSNFEPTPRHRATLGN